MEPFSKRLFRAPVPEQEPDDLPFQEFTPLFGTHSLVESEPGSGNRREPRNSIPPTPSAPSRTVLEPSHERRLRIRSAPIQPNTRYVMRGYLARDHLSVVSAYVERA